MSKFRKNFLITVFLLFFTIVVVNFSISRETIIIKDINIGDIPFEIQDWQGSEIPISEELYRKIGADAVVFREYKNPKNELLWLYIGFYKQQKEGSRPHAAKRCYPGQGWSILDQRIESIILNEDKNLKMEITKLLLRKKDKKRSALYWYSSRNRVMRDEFTQNLYALVDSFLYGRNDVAFVHISAPISNNDFAKTLEYEKNFIRMLVPLLNNYLP